MSDTPRTNEKLLILCTDSWECGSGWMDSYGAGSAPEDEQYVPASLARELERENTRLQMELDASCNAEELRQYRHANQFLITNQGAYERENALLRDALRECLDGIAYSISHNTMLLPISYTPPAYLEKLARHRSLLPDAVDVCPDSALPNA